MPVSALLAAAAGPPPFPSLTLACAPLAMPSSLEVTPFVAFVTMLCTPVLRFRWRKRRSRRLLIRLIHALVYVLIGVPPSRRIKPSLSRHRRLIRVPLSDSSRGIHSLECPHVGRRGSNSKTGRSHPLDVPMLA